MRKIRGVLSHFWLPFLDVFLPSACAACSRQVREGKQVCTECLQTLQRVNEQRRVYERDKKFSHADSVDDFFPAFLFEKHQAIQHILHAMKYGGKFGLARQMGALAGLQLQSIPQIQHADGIIAIPLHWSKLFERKYNQADYISKGITDITGIPFVNNVVKRIKPTKTQTKLNLQERRENMSAAFRVCNPGAVIGKKIVLVDDVITTGATIAECAAELKSAGAAAVYAVSVALAD